MDGGLKDLSFPRKDLSAIPQLPEVIVPLSTPVLIEEWAVVICAWLRSKIDAALFLAWVEANPVRDLFKVVTNPFPVPLFTGSIHATVLVFGSMK